MPICLKKLFRSRLIRLIIWFSIRINKKKKKKKKLKKKKKKKDYYYNEKIQWMIQTLQINIKIDIKI